MKIFVLINDRGEGIKTFYQEAKVEFQRLNKAGWGVFSAVNDFEATEEEMKQAGVATKRNIPFLKKINYVFADLDIAKKGDGQSRNQKESKKDGLLSAVYDVLPPTSVIDTSNGLQPLWGLREASTEAIYQQRYVDVINAIIRWSKLHGGMGDKVKDVTRVLREPGYYHMKEEPYLCTKKYEDTRLVYTLEQLEEKFLRFLQKPVELPVTEVKVFKKNDISIAIDYLDFQELIRRAFGSIGRSAEFDKTGRLELDGRLTGTFQGRKDSRDYLASTSHEPFQGNRITAVADILGVTNKEARAWIVEEFRLKTDDRKIKASVVQKEAARYAVDERPKIFTWGTPGLDKKITPLAAGQLNFITGNTGMGKTTFSLNAAQKNVKLGHKVLYISLEQDKQGLVTRLARAAAGIGKEEWRDRANIIFQKKEKFKKKVDEINADENLILYGFGKGLPASTDNIFAVIKEINPDLVFIDNFDDIQKDAQSEYTEQNRVILELKAFAAEVSLPINVLHHRNAKKTGDGIGAVRGSGKISDTSWTLLKCWRLWDEDASPEDNAKFFIQHEKDREFGTCDLAIIYWQQGTFSDKYI